MIFLRYNRTGSQLFGAGIFTCLYQPFFFSTEEPSDNNYFKGEEVSKNLYIPDSEDEDDEEDDESTPFEKLARKMTDICPFNDGGVLKQILKHGSGEIIPEGSVARIHFNAYQEYADEPYDSSR